MNKRIEKNYPPHGFLSLFFKRMGLILLLGWGTLFSAWSQSLTVTGKIVDAGTKESLTGVIVTIEGTTTGTITDAVGTYKITLPNPKAILNFKYLGYLPEKVNSEGRTVIDIELVQDITSLDEVVVIGYGSSKRKDLTGSVSSVNSIKLKDIPVSSVAESLTGKLAGVQVTTTEGSPDADVKIRIRGGGSITRSNTPLYIVDGFPVDRISDIPPTDIQSVDVLKDASSTAIYGSRGANGVVIVTTRSAKDGKLTFNYNGYYGIKKVTKKMDVMSPYEFAKWQYEQSILQTPDAKQYENYFGSFADMDLYKSMKGTNWQDVVFGKTGTTQNHSLSITGGSDKINFNAGYDRLDDKAIMMGSSFTRDNLNLKLNTIATSWLKFNFAVRYSDTQVKGGGANDVTGTEKSTSDSRLKSAIIYTPIPLSNMTAPDDNAESSSSLYPPTSTIPDNDRFQQNKDFNILGGVSIDILKGLVWRSEAGFDYSHTTDNRFFGLTTYYVTTGDATLKNMPASQLKSENISSFRAANYLTGTLNIDKHSFSLMAGEENIDRTDNGLTTVVEGLPVFFNSTQAWSYTAMGTARTVNNFYYPDDKLLSFFGRFNYNFKDKYLLSATFRADGSSKFAKGNQWGYFPSAAVAWRMSDEKFLTWAASWLSNLKLRASYGTAGNNNIPALMYMQIYNATNTSYLPASLSTSYLSPQVPTGSSGPTMSNQKLKWETTVTRNAGFDFGFFRDRINGSAEAYMNNTKDLLIDIPTPGSGYTTQTRNVGKTTNKGIEVTLDAAIIQNRNFHLNFSFNISINRNKVENLGGLSEINGNSGWTSDAQASNDYRVRVGQPVGLMYGYQTDGFYSTKDFDWNGTSWVLKNKSAATPDNQGIDGTSWGPGALKLKDLNGDGVIDENDRTIIGHAMPKTTGGFTISASYKGFDLAAVFNWVYGNNIYNANKIEFTTVNKYKYRNMLADMNSSNRWTNIDPTSGQRVTDPAQLDALNANAKIWSPNLARNVFHSWAVEDGSFLRLNNVTMGYTIPEKLSAKFHVKQLRLYVSGYNLHIWTKYTGFDPEVDSRRLNSITPGVDYSAYPKSRTCNFGINITF